MMTHLSYNSSLACIDKLLKADRSLEAIELCRHVCEMAEAQPDDWLLYGCLCADTGDTTMAAIALRKATDLDPSLCEAQFGLGKILLARGDNTAAIEPLRNAVQLQPDNANLWLSLGIAYGLATQTDSAEKCCIRAVELSPNSALALFNLGNALQAQRKLSEAELQYMAALAIEPKLPHAWSQLARIRLSLGKSVEAETAALEAVTLEPGLGEAHFVLGEILEARGEAERAKEYFLCSTKLMPGLPEAHMKLGNILTALGDHAGAVESLQRALDLNPALPEAHFLQAESFAAQNLRAQAEASYRKVLTFDKDHLSAHYSLAFMLLATNRNNEAAQHFAEIIRINPADEQAQHLLAAQRGETSSSAPAAYVATLFDGFADTFDSKLVDKLNYRTPELVHQLVEQSVAPAANSLQVIDLGCGTGLCAPLFRGMASTLHGVDLSPRMVEKARQRNLYDALEVGDITASLQAKAAAWDLAIAADVLVYLGDLRAVFMACASALKPGGWFAFSVEAGDGSDGYVLRQSGRYAHATDYIRALASAAGMHEVVRQAVFLRHEKGRKMPGYLFLLRLAAPASFSKNPYRIHYGYLHGSALGKT